MSYIIKIQSLFSTVGRCPLTILIMCVEHKSSYNQYHSSYCITHDTRLLAIEQRADTMWTAIILLSIITVTVAEITAPGIDRTLSDGVKSVGYNIVYGDEDMEMVNEVVSEVEKGNSLKSRINLNEHLPPLPAQDVKCLMSVDRYCSREMGKMKGVLIQALKDDCEKCSKKEKEAAGKVVASMMAHDPVAWKLFLTRSALHIKEPKPTPKHNDVRLVEKGEPEEIVSQSKYTMPGFKVRVKRYAAEKM